MAGMVVLDSDFKGIELTSSRRERTLEIIVRLGEIIPFYGRKIQVSELL